MSSLIAVVFEDETTAFDMRAAQAVNLTAAGAIGGGFWGMLIGLGLKTFAGKGKIFQTSLGKDDEASLREALEQAP